MATGGPANSDSNREPDRAVVLLGPAADAPSDFEDALGPSGTLFEVVRHPLLAAADLVRLERDVRLSGSSSRTTLWVVGREIDDLGELFQSVRTHLPRVSVRVLVQGERLTVFEGAIEPARAPEVPPAPRADARGPSRRPTLRYTGDADGPDGTMPASASTDLPATRPDAGTAEYARVEHDEDPPGPSGSAPTPEELEMLLSMFDEDPLGGKGGRS